jgi:hypothetical protein
MVGGWGTLFETAAAMIILLFIFFIYPPPSEFKVNDAYK